MKRLELGLSRQERALRDEQRRTRNCIKAIGVVLTVLVLVDCLVLSHFPLVGP